ncbi:EXS family-domain-containing protein [Lipomyces japonicus]|uniref:EXS family-domain-containing protein n=1 Tax=Lipomyces japonicus TaxID=56871 RepID=UPI0034CFD888
MKFARYLNDNLVPEWRHQYLDYKEGKKRLKKLAKKSGNTPVFIPAAAILESQSPSERPGGTPKYQNLASSRSSNGYGLADISENMLACSSSSSNENEDIAMSAAGVAPHQLLNTAPPIPIATKESALHNIPNTEVYGSMMATPPGVTGTFALPPPALADNQQDDAVGSAISSSHRVGAYNGPSRSVTFPSNIKDDDASLSIDLGSPAIAPDRAKSTSSNISRPRGYSATESFSTSQFPLSRRNTVEVPGTPRSTRSGILKKASKYSPNGNAIELAQSGTLFRKRSISSSIKASFEDTQRKMTHDEAYRSYITWLDLEFDKIQSFYREKEEEAVIRFGKIKDQLHLLRDQRLQERELLLRGNGPLNKNQAVKSKSLIQQTKQQVDSFYKKLDLHHLPLMSKPKVTSQGNSQDYVRRQAFKSVPYAVAKRKLKTAVNEYYRGLELLKSYRLLNRTGMQKITKKFDKANNSTISTWYMDKVKFSYFGQSNIIDDLMNQTEDVYSRYFEHGNRKNAIEKLRTRAQPKSHYSATFTSGMYLGLGIPLFLQALVIGVQKGLSKQIPDAIYLFQIWAGAFLMILFSVLFAINCFVWTKYKINYPFIFEWDRKHFLEFRQYLELPAFFFFWLSLCMWLCFSDFWPQRLPAQWYPVLFVGVSLLAILLPLPFIHWRAREWLMVALWRLVLSGLYPVEFRDFFLGDIFCSLAYSLSNISLFFCIYRFNWVDPPRCGSSHSRLMGFLNALPPLWRFLQCLRRYADTRSWFPHLANAGKYTFTIVTAITLSIWRIDRVNTNKDVYILFAAINTVYSSFWDLFMDWSLFQTGAKHKFLRNELGFRNPIYYYIAMIADPLMRLNWIFYVIFPVQVQQSAMLSFFIALVEVLRRVLWIFFRMENEHCTNVGRFVASRNLPLPYNLDETADRELTEINIQTPLVAAEEGRFAGLGTGPTEGPLPSPMAGTPPIRRRKSFSVMTPRMMATAMSTAIRDAHAQDFERRKRPRSIRSNNSMGGRIEEEEEEEEEEEGDEESGDDIDNDYDDLIAEHDPEAELDESASTNDASADDTEGSHETKSPTF